MSKVRASHILVDSEAKAAELKKQIEGGASFEDLAKKNSSCPSGKDGGDLGWFGKGMMVKEFEQSCFSMNPGQVSAPVKTQFGFHLIKLTEAK